MTIQDEQVDAAGIAARLKQVQQTVTQAAQEAGHAVQLVAVSKTWPAQSVLAAYRAGQSVFGENYAQEGCDKVDWFAQNAADACIEWHFIGPLQGNKTRMVAERFDWVDSVDRLRIAKRLNDQRPADRVPLNVLIEVNIDDEDSKSGVRPEEVPELAREIAALPNLRLRGLMAIPAPASDPQAQRQPLLAMRALFDAHKDEFGWDTLSMGMSADMTQAIACGSTTVRVGSAIFGARDYSKKKSA